MGGVRNGQEAAPAAGGPACSDQDPLGPSRILWVVVCPTCGPHWPGPSLYLPRLQDQSGCGCAGGLLDLGCRLNSRKSPAGSTLVAPTSWQPRLSGRGGSGVSAPWWPLGLQQEPGESPASGQLGSGCYCPTAFVSNRDTNRSSPFTRLLPEGTQLAGVGALPAWVSRGGRPGSRAPPEAGVHGGVWGASRLS